MAKYGIPGTKEYFKNRYESYTESQVEAHRARGRRWAAENRVRSRCSTHTANIRKKFPERLVAGDLPDAESLQAWFESQEPVCPYCGLHAYSIDHRVPLSAGGEHTSSNLQLVCLSCNIMKHKHSHEEFLTQVKRIADNLSMVGNFH